MRTSACSTASRRCRRSTPWMRRNSSSSDHVLSATGDALSHSAVAAVALQQLQQLLLLLPPRTLPLPAFSDADTAAAASIRAVCAVVDAAGRAVLEGALVATVASTCEVGDGQRVAAALTAVEDGSVGHEDPGGAPLVVVVAAAACANSLTSAATTPKRNWRCDRRRDAKSRPLVGGM